MLSAFISFCFCDRILKRNNSFKLWSIRSHFFNDRYKKNWKIHFE